MPLIVEGVHSVILFLELQLIKSSTSSADIKGKEFFIVLQIKLICNEISLTYVKK